MEDINAIFFSGVFESSDVLITGLHGFARRVGFSLGNAFSNLPGRTNRSPLLPQAAPIQGRNEVTILYQGRARECLMMTSERIVIPDEDYTLGQLLCSLYRRGDRWVAELDDSNLMCMVNGHEATLFDTIEAGAEVRIAS